MVRLRVSCNLTENVLEAQNWQYKHSKFRKQRWGLMNWGKKKPHKKLVLLTCFSCNKAKWCTKVHHYQENITPKLRIFLELTNIALKRKKKIVYIFLYQVNIEFLYHPASTIRLQFPDLLLQLLWKDFQTAAC